VVLPAPKKPVKIVTGTASVDCMTVFWQNRELKQLFCCFAEELSQHESSSAALLIQVN
jgi:hypothetical protein